MKFGTLSKYGRSNESLPTRGAWVEIVMLCIKRITSASLPTRGAWVEILLALSSINGEKVAPHAGSVG